MIYKVIKPELFKKDTKLLGKYDLWENNAMTPTHICHIKSFGSKKDVEFGMNNHFWMGFNTENNILKIECDSYGGMAGFEFTKEDLKIKGLSKNDRDCMNYNFDLIDELIEEKIIEKEPMKEI